MSLVGPRPMPLDDRREDQRLGPAPTRPHARDHRHLAGPRAHHDPVRGDDQARLPVRHELEGLGRRQAAPEDGVRRAEPQRSELTRGCAARLPHAARQQRVPRRSARAARGDEPRRSRLPRDRHLPRRARPPSTRDGRRRRRPALPRAAGAHGRRRPPPGDRLGHPRLPRARVPHPAPPARRRRPRPQPAGHARPRRGAIEAAPAGASSSTTTTSRRSCTAPHRRGGARSCAGGSSASSGCPAGSPIAWSRRTAPTGTSRWSAGASPVAHRDRTQRPRPDPLRRAPTAARAPGGRFTVGWVGTMGHHDGLDHLLLAMRHLVHDLGLQTPAAS